MKTKIQPKPTAWSLLNFSRAGFALLTSGTLLPGLALASMDGPPNVAGEPAQTALNASGPTTTALLVSDLGGEVGSQRRYSVEVPPGAANLVLSTEGGIGDVDLYAKAASAPTTTDNDCLSETTTTVESCTIPHPQATLWHVLLESSAGYSGATLKVSYETPVRLSVTKQGAGTGMVTSHDIQSRFSWPDAAHAVTPRIVGGFTAQNESWPWQVQLSRYGMFHCGGSILSNRWVVTAAHCLSGLPANALKVRAGSIIVGDGGQQTGVQRTILHEKYDSETSNNDIALLELDEDLRLSDTAWPIEPLLPTNEPELAPEGELATVTGWGATDSGGFGSSTLRQVSVPLITPESCRSSAYGYGNAITDNMVCAGYRFGEKDSCQGDSGGPMVVPNGRGAYALAGIVSWGTGCAEPGYPGVYTRAANYRGWIEQQTGLSFGQPLIDCGSACSASLGLDSIVTLRASASPGSLFAGWSGDCSGTDECRVEMNANKTASANFIELPKYLVKMIKPGDGLITSDPAGIFCGGAHSQCIASFSYARLTASPEPGYEFIKWMGCQVPEGNICTLNPTRKMTLQAIFRKLPKQTITIRKNTLGSIISAPPGLLCGDKKRSCSLKLVKGTEVTLTPAAQVGRSFAGWIGDCSGTDPCRLLMNSNKALGATFR